MFAPKFKAKAPSGSGIWSPKNQTPTTSLNDLNFSSNSAAPTPPPPPVHPIWTPQPSPSTGRKEFRPVRFESPTLPRKYLLQHQNSLPGPVQPPWSTASHTSNGQSHYQWASPSPRSVNSCTNLSTPTTTGSGYLDSYNDPSEYSVNFAPTTASVSDKIKTLERSTSASELTQPFGRRYLDTCHPVYKPNEVIYKVKHEYMSEPETENDRPKKMAQLSRRQFEGIGPVTNDGMPIVLRSEVKEPHQHEWYKRLYQTIHKQKTGARPQYKSTGYQSEPEPNYDSDYSTVKYRTLDRRRLQSVSSAANVRSGANSSQDERYYGTMPNPIKSGQNSYKNQPGRIENYITGHSSVSDKEKKEWWDEVMDIFNGWLKDNAVIPCIIIEFANDVNQLEQSKLSPHYTEGNLSRALAKESGYTSDSNLVFRKKEVPQSSPLSPVEQKQAYKSVQAGGEPPLFGFRKPAPEKHKGFVEDFEYLQITPTLTKIRVICRGIDISNKGETDISLDDATVNQVQVQDKLSENKLNMFTNFSKNLPSFIPLSHKKEAPPPPPSRTKSSCKKTPLGRVPKSKIIISSRHEQCFRSPDSVVSVGSKYETITLRKHVRREPICRSKSTGAVTTTIPKSSKEAHLNDSGDNRNVRIARSLQHPHHTRGLESVSPTRKQPRVATLRQSSRSPIAFGRSISKERTFAEEKKRLENTLPLSCTNFEASTNILRDPSLRSPQDVKHAVRSYATCSTHARSKSVPPIWQVRTNPGSTLSTTIRHTMCFPQCAADQMKMVECSRTAVEQKRPAAGTTTKDRERSLTTKNLIKSVTNESPSRTDSTFSVNSSAARVVVPRDITATGVSTKKEAEKKLQSKHSRSPKVKTVTTLCDNASDSNIGKDKKMAKVHTQKMPKPLALHSSHYYHESKLDNEWNGFSVPDHLKNISNPNQIPTGLTNRTFYSFQESRSLSPARAYVSSDNYTDYYKCDDDKKTECEGTDNINNLIWQYEQKDEREPRSKSVNIVRDIARPESPTLEQKTRKFSPTREVRVEQTPRNVRSPSRRRIESYRTNLRGDTKQVIRASSLSSADDRSKRGLYLCGELAHSATSLTHYERHSPTCRYRNNSERFTDLNRFYNTLERVGQLERATSLTNFKPIRKDSELLDFDEWRKIRLHEKAEKELNYLVNKLKQDQRTKDLVFRPKDVDDIKWRKETDFGLHSKEKSVEDLREAFERRMFLKDYDQHFKTNESNINRDYVRPHWRRNTVADLASSLEVKLHPEYTMEPQKPHETREQNEFPLSNRLVSTLSKEQILKITQQLNEIYSNNPKGASASEEYIMTVDRESKPTAATNILKVRCSSSLTKDDLLGPTMRKKEVLAKAASIRRSEHSPDKAVRSSSPVILARETRGAIASQNAGVIPRPPHPPEIPPHPVLNANKKYDIDDIDSSSSSRLVQRIVSAENDSNSNKLYNGESKLEINSNELYSLGIPKEPKENITQKIQFFEDRQFEEPPKTIYHAREDSSPDENEVMRIIEENMKSREMERQQHKHKELSSSLTDLKGIFGEKNSPRVNFHLHSPPQRPPDASDHPKQQHSVMEISKTCYDLENITPHSSIETFETYYRSRSLSPESQSSSYLHRVNTGEVERIKQKFESFESEKDQHDFFGLSSLRKARSDPGLKSKDALKTLVHNDEHVNVSCIAHKFELTNYRMSSTAERSRRRKRAAISPNSLKYRLMPHIDIISKTAALNQNVQLKRKQTSPTRSTSSNGNNVERIRSQYECPISPSTTSKKQLAISTSNPDLRDVNIISQHLTANWIAHKFPSPKHNTYSETEQSQKLRQPSNHRRGERIRRSNSSSPRRPPKSIHHQECTAMTSVLKPYYDDIFANQEFDPKIHQPKARYVPDGAEINDSKKVSAHHHHCYTGRCDTVKGSMAVTFQDYAPPVPPQPPTKNGNCSESPSRYLESDVNIHFKTPIRHEYKTPISEEQLAYRQAGQMQKLYQEERRRKYLQELQDMNSRRHTDNFTPSQKSPIPLNRYDDFQSDLAPKSPIARLVARALYNFQGQNARELSFRKGDLIYIRRLIDKNWYEGEHNAMIGLLPVNYIEIINKDGPRQQPKKPSEGQARAKYNFQAQSGVELSLNKGELVTLTRRVDDNWFEGKIANRKGIFPMSYVEVLTDIGAEDIAAKTVITEHSTTNLRPSLDTLRTNINNEFNIITQNGNQPPNGILKETKNLHKTDILHVDTSSVPLTYRALYKYRPQNSDELELLEGDVVHVLEKCDDGWFVGTSQRTGCFGTFPGNYVERT